MSKLIFNCILFCLLTSCNKDDFECLLHGTWEFSYVYDIAGLCSVYCGTSPEDAPCKLDQTSFYDYCQIISFYPNGICEVSFDVNDTYTETGTWFGGCATDDVLNIQYENLYYSITINSIDNQMLTVSDNAGGGALLYKNTN